MRRLDAALSEDVRKTIWDTPPKCWENHGKNLRIDVLIDFSIFGKPIYLGSPIYSLGSDIVFVHCNDSPRPQTGCTDKCDGL
jgi:hypothetical protein